MTKKRSLERGFPVSNEPDENSSHSAISNIRIQIGNTPQSPKTSSKQRFKPEILTSAELTEERIGEISDYFRFIFNNDWPQFAVCPPCDSQLPDGMRISAMDVFKTEAHLPLEQIDGIKTLPDCPHCGSEMQIFHDPKQTSLNLQSKLQGDGFVSLLRSGEANQISGFTFGYGCTLEKEFWHEWRNKYHYMAQEDVQYDRDFDTFIRRLNEEFPDEDFTPESEVFCWNCVATSPEARGTRYSFLLMKNFFNSLPLEKRNLYIVGETLSGSNSHRIFRTLGGKDVTGILEGEDVIIAGNMGRVIDRINRVGRKL